MDCKKAKASVSHLNNKHLNYLINNNSLRIIIDIFLAILFMVLANNKIGFWFDGNDDNTIAAIVSGQLSESPSCHVYFPSIIYGLIFSSLYRINKFIPWYGIGQLCLIFLIIFIPVRVAEKRCKTIFSYITTMVISFLTVISGLKMYTFVQFTTISALLAICGYVVLILSSNRKKSTYIGFAALQFLSFITRPLPMLMIQPIGFACLTFAQIFENFSNLNSAADIKSAIKKIAIRLTLVFLIVLSVAGVTKAIDICVYNSDEWRQAMEIDKSRANMNDYYFAPSYDDVKYILDIYEIGPDEYDAFKNTQLFNPTDYIDVCNDINSYLENASNPVRPSFIENLYWILVKSYIGHIDITILTILFLFLVAISARKHYYLAAILYYFGKMFSWGYVYNTQRLVDRVMYPLYYSEKIFLLCMILIIVGHTYSRLSKPAKKYILPALAIMIIAFLSMIIRKTYHQYNECTSMQNVYSLFYDSALSVPEYCSANPEVKYIITGDVYMYWKYPILSSSYSIKGNYIVLGGWFCPSPESQQYINKYLSDGDIYIIVSTDPALSEANNHFMNYCQAYFNKKVVYVDDIVTKIGTYAQVYQLTD